MKKTYIDNMNNIFMAISENALKYRWLYICLIIIISVFAFHSAKNIKMDNSVEAYFLDDDEHFLYYKSFTEEFGYDKFIYIIYDNPFSSDIIKLVDLLASEITSGLNKNRGDGKSVYLKKITTLANVEFVEGKNNELYIEPLLDGWDGSLEAIEPFRKKMLKKELFLNTLVNKDGSKGAILIELNKIDDELNSDSNIDEIVQTIIQNDKFLSLNLVCVGNPILNASYNRTCQSEALRNIAISFIAIFLILWILFKTPVGIIGPVLTVNIALLWIAGIMPIFNIKYTMMLSILPALLLVVGIGASIHIVSEFQFLSGIFDDKKNTILKTYKIVGFPCFITALTTAIGIGSMMVSEIRAIKDFAFIAALGIGFTFLLTLFFLPGILSLSRFKKNKAPILLQDPPSLVDRFHQSIGRINDKYASLILFLAAGIILISFWGMTKVKVDACWLDEFGDKVKVKQDYHYVDKTMGGSGSFNLVFDTKKQGGIKSPEFLEALADIHEYAMKFDIVMSTVSVVDFIKDINRSIHNENQVFYTIPNTSSEVAQLLLLYEDSGGEELLNYVNFSYEKATLNIKAKTVKTSLWKEFCDEITQYANKRMEGLASVRMTGISFLGSMTLGYINQSQIKGFLIAFVIITLMLIILFRSFKQGLFLMIPNLFPIVLTLGIMGFLKIELDYVKLFIACIAIGIAVDDTIHFATRYRYEFLRLQNYSKAMHMALKSVGKAMMFTSIVLIVGFIINIFSIMDSFVSFGILTSFTIVIALVADYFLAPSIIMKTHLFGHEQTENDLS